MAESILQILSFSQIATLEMLKAAISLGLVLLIGRSSALSKCELSSKAGHTFKRSPVFIQHLGEDGDQTFATQCIKCRTDQKRQCKSARIECPLRPTDPVVEYTWRNSEKCEGEPARVSAVPEGFITCPGPDHHSPESIDLERFVGKLLHDFPEDFKNASMAEDAIAEYRRMLILVQKIPNQPVVPSPLVDLVWHSHILDTQQYTRDSLRMFGQYMHHQPSFGGKEEKLELVAQQKEMFESYKREFGEDPQPIMWNIAPKSADDKVGGAFPDCCSAECVKPACKGCVGCNAVSCGYEKGKQSAQLLSPNRFSGYVPTSNPLLVDVSTLNCGDKAWCATGEYLCSVEPFKNSHPSPIPMTLGWSISGDYIYFQHYFGGEAWYGVGLNSISGMVST